MSQISLNRKHSIGLPKAREAAQKVADDLAKEYGITSRWDGDVLAFTRSGVDGRLVVGKDAISVEAKLGFMLSAFKSNIERHINDQFDRYFA